MSSGRRGEQEHAAPEIIGSVPVYGDPERGAIDRRFVERLDGLTPTQRRLALARACALPWRNAPAKMPDCYRRDLETAEWEAREEAGDQGYSLASAKVDALIDPGDPPIRELFLRQLIPLRPSHRRAQLASACRAFSFLDREPPPEWIARFCDQAIGEEAEDVRLDRALRESA